jgi:hypothetical protein
MFGFQRDVLSLKNLKQLENNQKLMTRNQFKKSKLKRQSSQPKNKQLKKLNLNQLENKSRVELK